MNESKPHSEHVETLRSCLNALDSMGPKWREKVITGDLALNGLVEQYEGMAQAYREQRGMRESAEMRLAESIEQLEASQAILDDIARALDIFDMSGNDIGAGLTSEETLGFIRDAMDRRGSNPASEPKENCSAR